MAILTNPEIQIVVLIGLGIWLAVLIGITRSLMDIWLIGLLAITVLIYFVLFATAMKTASAIVLVAGITCAKAVRSLVARSQQSSCVVGLTLILGFASCLHSNVRDTLYSGPRWRGLWDNPNDYGLLMATGLVLSIGLLAQNLAAAIGKRREENRKSEIGNRKFALDSLRCPLPIILFIAALMLGTGLVMSYSRGAWIGATIGLLYLARSYGRFKWRYLLAPILIIAASAWFFWNTPRIAPWYFQRLDLNRGSVQHRLAAWRAGFEILRDYPFGVGWNRTVEVYQKNYSPPQDGAAATAITTNDYLMLGTQLGIPGLLCFVTYVALCFRGRARHSVRAALDGTGGQGTARPTLSPEASLRVACRSGALVCLVAFWFDGGLFKLATASVFWILLELGSEGQKLKTEMLKAETDQTQVETIQES